MEIVRFELQKHLIVNTNTGFMIDSVYPINLMIVKDIKHKLYHVDGFVNTVINGPEKVILQTTPISNLAIAVAACMSSIGN